MQIIIFCHYSSILIETTDLILHISSIFVYNGVLATCQVMKLNLDHPKINGETTALNAVTEVAAIMGENIKLRRGFLMSASSSGVISTYLHTSPQPGTLF